MFSRNLITAAIPEKMKFSILSESTKLELDTFLVFDCLQILKFALECFFFLSYISIRSILLKIKKLLPLFRLKFKLKYRLNHQFLFLNYDFLSLFIGIRNRYIYIYMNFLIFKKGVYREKFLQGKDFILQNKT